MSRPGWWLERVFADRTISADAKFLIIWFGTRPKGWRYSVPEARAVMGWGLGKYKSVVRETKAEGWVVTTHKHHSKTGRILHTILTVNAAKTLPPKGRFTALRPKGQKSTQTILSKDRATASSKNQAGLRIIGGRDV